MSLPENVNNNKYYKSKIDQCEKLEVINLKNNNISELPKNLSRLH